MKTISNENVTGIRLATVAEVEEMPKWTRSCGHWWWLKDKGTNDGCVMYVDSFGSVIIPGEFPSLKIFGDRPVILTEGVDFTDVELFETVKVFGRFAYYLGNDKIMICDPIAESCFGDTNEYDDSYVKSFLEDWLQQQLTPVTD